jgi:hypothetical protein
MPENSYVEPDCPWFLADWLLDHADFPLDESAHDTNTVKVAEEAA